MSYFNTIQLDSSNLTAFGDLVTSEMVPVVQIGFSYGLLTVDGSAATSGTGATVDTNLARLRVQSGTTATTGSAVYTSKKAAVYREGQGLTARFTAAFTTGVTGNVQEVGIGTAADGYFFGYNGTSFGILHRNSSTGSLVETWTVQGSWNGNVPSGFDPTKGNVFQIRYPYLGYGDIFFYIQDATTGKMQLVHTIRYANSITTTQLSNPNLNFRVRSANTGANTTNMIIYVGSAAIFINGAVSNIDAQFAIDNNKSAITTETNILSLKSATTFNTVPNQGVVKLRSLSFGGLVTGSNPTSLITVRLKKGVTLGGSPAYAAISGSTADSGTTITSAQSCISYDTAGTTITGGSMVFNASVNCNQACEIDLLSYNIYILPAEILTFSIACSASAQAFVAINWLEDL